MQEGAAPMRHDRPVHFQKKKKSIQGRIESKLDLEREDSGKRKAGRELKCQVPRSQKDKRIDEVGLSLLLTTKECWESENYEQIIILEELLTFISSYHMR